MKWASSIVVALALAVAPAAQAEEKAAADPVKVELARKLVAASGGAENAEKIIRGMHGSMNAAFDGIVPADKRQVFDAMQRDIQEETIKLVPVILEQSVDVYARLLTEKELKDMLAWSTSETGQSVARKMPAIMQEVMKAQVPYLQQMMPRMIQKAMDHACDEAKCTPEERREVATIVQQALSKSPS